MNAVPPRRDNGLRAPTYARLDDVETHLVDELLDRLRQAGVAAYSAPTLGRRGPYGETVPPLGPSDSVYVDAAHRATARQVTDSYLREVRDDLAWSDIVAGFNLDLHEEVPRWPVSEDVDPDEESARESASIGPTIGFDSLRDSTPASPVMGADEGSAHRRTDRDSDDPEDHFQPPPPPPLPDIDRISRFAWAGALGGPLLLVIAALFGVQLEGWVGLLALVSFMAGFVTLVARMKDRPPTDSGPDDGAVV
jgi:hypothetical protein